MELRDWILVLVAIFVPPVAVWFKRGFFSRDLLINVLLFLFGFFPGLIHALYVISTHPSVHTLTSSNHHNSQENNNENEESLLNRTERYGSV